MEKKRGCGYRKEGALYLVGCGIPIVCDRLPYELSICPICGAGVKFSRGFTWLDWYNFANVHKECKDKYICPLCNPKEGDKFGLLWVGKKFYTTESFIKEAITMGVSKRIAHIPKDLELGKTRIMVAHPEAVVSANGDKSAGIFYSFIAQRVEQLLTKDESEDTKYIDNLKKRGITPILKTE